MLVPAANVVYLYKNYSMIQRVQTLYLTLALILMSLLLLFPLFAIEMIAFEGDVNQVAYLNQNGVMMNDGTMIAEIPLKFMYIGLALFTTLCILMYKKRPRQLMLTRFNFILHLLFIIGIYAVYYFGESLIVEGMERQFQIETEVVFHVEIGFFLLIPTVAFIFLAIRGIKRDETLVKSLDRIR